MKRIIIICLVVLAGCYISVFADNEIGTKHKPGKGFTVESPDKEFSLTTGGRIQLRHTYDAFDADRDKEDISIFTVQRIRIWLKGKAFKDWKYKFQVDFGKGGVSLKDGLIEYARYEYGKVTVGQFKVFFDRQQRISSGSQTFVDRSIAAKKFGIGRDIGVQVHGATTDKKFQYNAGVYNGEGEGKKNPNNGHLFSGRVSFNPLGDFGLSESDIRKSDKHLVFIDAAASLNAKRIYTDWSDNDTLGGAADEADVLRYVFGAGYRYAGLYVQGEYYGQTENPNLAGLADVKANGWYAQAGYMIVPEAWELAARYSVVDANTDVDDNLKSEAMAGINCFIHKGGHAMKITADIAQLAEEKGPGMEYKDIRARVQLQVIY